MVTVTITAVQVKALLPCHLGQRVVLVVYIVIGGHLTVTQNIHLRRGRDIAVVIVGIDRDVHLCGRHTADAAHRLLQASVGIILILYVVTLRQLYLAQQFRCTRLCQIRILIGCLVTLGIGEALQLFPARLLVVEVSKGDRAVQRVSHLTHQVSAAEVREL